MIEKRKKMRKVKKIEFNAENYDFQKAMKQNIREKIEPLLYENQFTKCTQNKYIRERGELIQEILFSPGKHKLKAFASYIPIFLPFDNILNYGIEITGSGGHELLGGKYFTTIYEEEWDDKAIQFRNYKRERLEEFHKLTLSIAEGILPEMNDKINSLDAFIHVFKEGENKFFEHKIQKGLDSGPLHEYIMVVYQCLNEDFEEGILELEKLIDMAIYIQDEKLKEYIERLLIPKEGEDILTKEKFLINYNEICDERRRKYKLLK